MKTPVRTWQETGFLVGFVLIATVIAYSSSLDNRFTNWDDPAYILENRLIHDFSWNNLKTIFSTGQFRGNYHPLTLVAHSIEYQLFGDSPEGYRIVHLFLHLCVTMLLFRFAYLIVDDTAVAGLAALLFGIHPVHVESVVWASQLKDLLYSFFYLWALLFYIAMHRDPHRRTLYFFLSIVAFIFSILAKGLAVTLPLALLCIDFIRGRAWERKLWLEKLPYLALAIGFGMVAVIAQGGAGAITAVHHDSIAVKIVFASYGVVSYLIKFIIPYNLSPYYPYPDSLTGVIPSYFWLFLPITLGLVYLIWHFRHLRLLVFGAMFFVATIFPVLQILQVGSAIMADRYMYIPSVGLCIVLASGLIVIQTRVERKLLKHIMKLSVAVYIVWLILATWNQSNVWQDSITLWTNVLNRYPDVPLALDNRGNAYHSENREDEAIADFNRALALKPDDGHAYYNRALSFVSLGRIDAAKSDFALALQFLKDDADVYAHRGVLHLRTREFAQAADDFSALIQLRPGDANAYANRGMAYSALRNLPAAFADLTRAVELERGNATHYFNRANVLASTGKYALAVADYSAAIERNAKDGEAYHHRGLVHQLMKNQTAACSDFRTAARLGYQPAVSALSAYCN